MGRAGSTSSPTRSSSTKHATDGQPHIGRLSTVDEDTWHKMTARTEIQKEIGKDEAERASFRVEGASKCFNRHNRPDQGCIDWHSKEKTRPSTRCPEAVRHASRQRHNRTPAGIPMSELGKTAGYLAGLGTLREEGSLDDLPFF